MSIEAHGALGHIIDVSCQIVVGPLPLLPPHHLKKVKLVMYCQRGEGHRACVQVSVAGRDWRHIAKIELDDNELR